MTNNEVLEIKKIQEKPKAGLLLGFSKSLQAVAELATIGAAKYEANSWQNVQDGEEVYTDAMLRHLLDEGAEVYDKETSILHATAVAFNALARLHFILQHRPNKNVSQTNQITEVENNVR
jgi:hypothetical protein